MTFTDALKSYYAKHPGGATRASYEGLFPYMQSLGFQVERPTRSARNPDGSRMLSSDKIVNSATGELFDIIRGVDEKTGAGPWVIGVPKTWKYWVNGKPSQTPKPGGATVLGSDDVLRNRGPVGDSMRTGTDADAFRQQMIASGMSPRMWASMGPQAAPGGVGTVLGMSSSQSDAYAAAGTAAMRQRKQARGSGRASTILGGFAPGRPSTRATVLGGY